MGIKNVVLSNFPDIATYDGNGNITGLTVGNITTSGTVVSSGSSGPQPRFNWNVWQYPTVTSTTPAGVLAGSATYNGTTAYGVNLTNNSLNQFGSASWNNNAIVYTNNMSVSASMAANSGTGGDGFGIVFGASNIPTASAQFTNTGGGIIVYNHFASNRWELYVNGTQTLFPWIPTTGATPSGFPVYGATNASFYDYRAELKTLGSTRYLEFYLNGTHQFTKDITGWTASGTNFGAVGATTVGAYSYTYCRSLRIDW